MENHLEHKIANAYKNREENFSYENKEKLWGQLANGLGHTNGVASVWRIAAVIFALLAFGSVFGVAFILNNNSKQIDVLTVQNAELQQTVDSLRLIVPEKITETVTVEKEKIVYRELKLATKNDKRELPISDYQQEIKTLKSKLSLSEFNLEIKKDSLARLQNKLDEFLAISKEKPEESKPEFQLKTEHVQEQMQPVKTGEVPKMKLQIIKIQDNIKYETGSTLLKK